MQYVNAVTACALLLLALAMLSDPLQAATFGVGAVLAAIAFKHWLRLWMVRVLAFVAAAAMFLYFGQFMSLVPTLQPDWYAQPREAIDAVGLLFAGFAMIPVLSEYSCRMKANEECERGRRQFRERKQPGGRRERKPLLAPLRRA